MELVSAITLILDGLLLLEDAPAVAEQLCGMFSIDREPQLFCSIMEHMYHCRAPRRKTYNRLLWDFLTRKDGERRSCFLQTFAKASEPYLVYQISVYFGDTPPDPPDTYLLSPLPALRASVGMPEPAFGGFWWPFRPSIGLLSAFETQPFFCCLMS